MVQLLRSEPEIQNLTSNPVKITPLDFVLSKCDICGDFRPREHICKPRRPYIKDGTLCDIDGTILSVRKCQMCDGWVPLGTDKCACTYCSSCKKWGPAPHRCDSGWRPVERWQPEHTPDVEDETYAFASFSRLQERLANKPLMDRYHAKFRTIGKLEDVGFFYFLLGSVDPDFPFTPNLPTSQISICQRCKGFVWDRVCLGPGDIKKAAHQAGIEVKIDEWKKSHKCKGEIKKMTIARFIASQGLAS